MHFLRTIKTIFTILIATFILASNLHALETKNKQALGKDFVSTAQYTALADELKEVKELARKQEEQTIKLDAQNKLMHDYHDSLIDMVLWSLGLVFTLALSLAGFSWWTNNKLYQADKNQLIDDFNTQIKQVNDAVDARLTTRYNELSAELNRISENYSVSLRTEINEVRSSIENSKEKSLEFDRSLNKIKGNLDANTLRMEKSLANQRIKHLYLEEKMWELKGIPYNVLLTQAQALEDALKLNDAYEITAIPERIKETLSDHFKGGKEELGEYLKDKLVTSLKDKKVDPIIANESLQIINEMTS